MVYFLIYCTSQKSNLIRTYILSWLMHFPYSVVDVKTTFNSYVYLKCIMCMSIVSIECFNMNTKLTKTCAWIHVSLEIFFTLQLVLSKIYYQHILREMICLDGKRNDHSIQCVYRRGIFSFEFYGKRLRT